MQFNDFGAQTFHVDFQLQFVFLSALMGFGFNAFKIFNPRFRFGGSRLGLSTHPFQFLFKGLFGFVCLYIFPFHACVAFLEIIAVVAFIGVKLSLIEFYDFVAHPFQKIAVVGHHQKSKLLFGEIPF